MLRVRIPLFPDVVRWLGVAAVAAVIVYFSLLGKPPAAPPEPGLGSFWDKKLHFAAYAAFGLALAYATAASRRPVVRRAAIVLVAAILFGVGIEILQGTLPERYFSYGDMLANAFGAVLAAGWFLVESQIDYVPWPSRTQAFGQ